MTEPSLFDAEATVGAARQADPRTSHQAAESMQGAVLRDQQVLVLTALLEHHRRLCEGGNSWELQCHLAGQSTEARVPGLNVIGKRLGELERAGWVHHPDGLDRPGPSHRNQHVYKPTAKAVSWSERRTAA
jgi:hypothetical protein